MLFKEAGPKDGTQTLIKTYNLFHMRDEERPPGLRVAKSVHKDASRERDACSFPAVPAYAARSRRFSPPSACRTDSTAVASSFSADLPGIHA